MFFAVLVYFGFGALFCKFVWNLTVPVQIIFRPYEKTTGATKSIGLELHTDLFFSVWTLLCIPFSDDGYLLFSKPSFALMTIGLLIFTLPCLVRAIASLASILR